MKNRIWIGGMVVTFLCGALAGVATARKAPFDTGMFLGKTPKEAAGSLLAFGKVQAKEKGSWERIAVGRIYYLSGQKTEGQAIFDEVTGSKKAEGGDFIRVGRVYWEAGEWDKARAAFDKVLELAPKDEDWLAEIGAYYHLKGNREKGEELFRRSFAIEGDNLSNTLRAAGSYVGVRPD